jgi:hypothetical protein
MKLIFFAFLVLLGLFAGGFLLFSPANIPEKINEEPVYQGPVRPTDDEAYFRKTGITKPLEVTE